jgi:hypothetical protein
MHLCALCEQNRGIKQSFCFQCMLLQCLQCSPRCWLCSQGPLLTMMTKPVGCQLCWQCLLWTVFTAKVAGTCVDSVSCWLCLQCLLLSVLRHILLIMSTMPAADYAHTALGWLSLQMLTVPVNDSVYNACGWLQFLATGFVYGNHGWLCLQCLLLTISITAESEDASRYTCMRFFASGFFIKSTQLVLWFIS